MFLLWIGVLVVILKFFEVWRFAELDWWYALAPLIVTFVWFEVFEKMVGADKKKMEANAWEKNRQDRVKANFEVKTPKGKRAKA